MAERTPIKFVHHSSVDLMWSVSHDDQVVIAARTSTKGGDARSDAGTGLINALIRERHGVPFEHSLMTFRIQAPIFVWRQLVKHRIGVSLSEESARYRELKPVFYLPSENRAIIQTGKPMEYKFEMASKEDITGIQWQMRGACEAAWKEYQQMLDAGVAREVARMVLPLNIFSTGILSFNARSMMHFLSLRTTANNAAFPSHPQFEIEQVAIQIESHFAAAMPVTYEAFNKYGRVAP